MTRKILLAVAAAVLLPGAAAAQIASGLSGSSSTSYMDGTEYWRTLRSFGACYAKDDEAGAWALIATEPDSKAEAAVYKRLAHGESQACLTDTVFGAPVALIRGAIAEGLYKRGRSAPAELALAAPVPGATIRTLGEATRCVASGHAEETRALLGQTVPGSKKEFAAVQALAPAFFDCLPPAARKRTFNPTQIRFRLAEALLRMPAMGAVPAGDTR